MHFPVRGHSYLPANRIFGQVEKKLRKVEEILDPSGYNEIYKEVANVRVLGKDWHIKNYNDLTKILKKIEGINDMKRIILEKVKKQNAIEVKIKLEPTYRFDDVSKTFSSMTKRGYQLNRDMTDRSNVPLASTIRDEKKDDVRKLLQARFGNDWESNVPLTILSFFNDALGSIAQDITEASEETEDNLFDCVEEEPAHHI
jgi:uncharacterized protein (UPF0297 family)